MSAEGLDTWLCPTCNSREIESHAPRQVGSSTAASSSGSDDEPSLNDVMAKLDMVLQRLNVLERNQEEQLEKHQATNDSIVKQAEIIQSMEASLETLSSKYDDIVHSLEGQKAEIKDISKKTHDLGMKVADQSARISFLENEVDRLEQYSRKYNVEIHGIKESDGEDLRSVLSSLANKLKLPVPRPEEIEAVHRVKARPHAIAPILVRFTSLDTRDKWLEQRTFLRGEKIFVNENLTARTKHLYWLTKNRATANQYRFVWVRNGKIYAKKEEGMSLIRIKREADLSKIGGIDD